MSDKAQQRAGPHSRTTSLVFFAFGVAGVPPGGTLPGRVLVRLLGDLGLSPSAARAAILRLRRERWLVSTPRGREAHYARAPAVQSTQRRLEQRFTGPRPEWDGAFHAVLYEVAERERSFRDALRRAAVVAGYGTLRPGLLVAPTDRWAELAPALEGRPPGSRVLRARLYLEPADARRVTAEIWVLEALAGSYRELAAAARRSTARARRRPPVGVEALQTFAAAVRPLYDTIGRDPGLPAELLPDPWPGDEIGRALGEAVRAFSPSVDAYIANVFRELGLERSA